MKKILIANRGEIAIRVMKTAKKMGISTVAVYSEADADALHVQMADEAYCIGPAPSKDSYLNQAKIIEVAKSTQTDGIHPGYGFLSENASFAKLVEDNGIRFIGPSPHSISIMGSKLDAKAAVSGYDIPMVPGTEGAVESSEIGKKVAKEIGYPVLIKASAGGGGKGMRLVDNEIEFEEQFNRAKSEARSSFGNDEVFVEKYITSPRHIEIQVLTDNDGNGIYLFERDCSIQRRHQKVVEEAPSGKISEEIRNAMGLDALKVASSCDYSGAGTVEFIMDDKGNYFFLEMNTRLQVEHPVTEMITGVDLVEQQIKVARGEKLSIKQEDLKINGHSIELRVYAENAKEGFKPSIGILDKYAIPSGDGIRVDHGFSQGHEIPIYYDPMIAKLVVWAETRREAITKMIQAISEYKIEGVETTLEFGSFVLNHEEFKSAAYDTKFVEKYFNDFLDSDKNSEALKIAALLSGVHWNKHIQKV